MDTVAQAEAWRGSGGGRAERDGVRTARLRQFLILHTVKEAGGEEEAVGLIKVQNRRTQGVSG